jgi:hypothetical protein
MVHNNYALLASVQKNEHNRVMTDGMEEKTKYEEGGAAQNEHSRGSSGGKK